jgi:hypothetical protein
MYLNINWRYTKMKVALLITGELRTLDLCKHSFKNAIIDKYDTDVFISVSSSDETPQEINSVTDFLKPIETHVTDHSCIESYMKLVNIEEYLKCTPFGTDYQQSDHFHINVIRRFLCEWNGICHAYRILKSHVDKTNIKYDHIARLRTDYTIFPEVTDSFNADFIFTKQGHIVSGIKGSMEYNKTRAIIENISRQIKVDFGSPNTNTIYVRAIGTTPSISFKNSLQWCGCEHWTHSHDLIPILMNMFINAPEILNESFSPDTFPKGPTFETFFCRYLQKHNISIQQSRIKTKLVFEYDKYNT